VKRVALVVGAITCLVLAVALLLVAADVLRWRNVLRADDVRYRVAPATSGLWSASTSVPFDPARSMLGITDDIALRRAVQAYRISTLDDASTSVATRVLRRAEAEDRLQDVAASDPDPARRSRALELLAVLRLSTPASNVQERAATVKTATADLQRAIALDPSNDGAKYNLETTLRRSRGVQQAQGGPTPNSRSSRGNNKGAATGPPTSGY